MVSYGTTVSNAYRGDWGGVVSGQVAVLTTNTAPLQSYLGTSNQVAINSTGKVDKTDANLLTAAEKAMATNAIRANGSVVYTGNQNFGTKDATNIGAIAGESITITGASGNGVVPVGAVMQYIASNAPSGWLLCNGAAVGTNMYPALFAVIGTQYGGATTNMNLPDLRGRVPVGMGSGAGLTVRNLNETGGVETVTLTTAQMPSHNHAVGLTSVGGGQQTILNTTQGGAADIAIWSGAAGSDNAHNNMPPYIVINYIIKY